MNKISVKQIKNIISELNIKENEFYNYKDKVKQKLNNINIEEFKNLNYKEMKELCSLLQYKIDKGIMDILLKIKNDKKIEEYPELLDAHYFKDILKLDYVSKEQRRELDFVLNRFKKWGGINIYRIFEEYSSCPIDDKLRDNVIKFLIDNKIIEEVYIFRCDDEIEYISKDYRNKFYRYFKLLDKYNEGTITKEEYNELKELGDKDYNEFYVEGDGGYYIDDIKSFEENMSIKYKVIGVPDTSLDEI